MYGHTELNRKRISELEKLIDNVSGNDIQEQFNRRFAGMVGRGAGISFASGRMALYCFLKSIEVGPGDEVILPAFTCSVMVNAILRTGAKPVFCDIDRHTFGSCAAAIDKKITGRTRVIIAQHSFGIPCEINDIVDLATHKNLYLVEDSAITFCSSRNGTQTGNFGDVAIFSTDHHKPLNTVTGGFLYTNNLNILKSVRKNFPAVPSLDPFHQLSIFKQLLFERRWMLPGKYPRARIFSFLNAAKNRLLKTPDLKGLETDYGRPENLLQSYYPYPAQLPAFVAQLGLWQLDQWPFEAQRRKNLLNTYLKIAKDSGIKNVLPGIYFDPQVDIIPLRFVYCHPEAQTHRNRMSKRIDTRQTWFREPVVECEKTPQEMGYALGSCPTAERVCEEIINWPCLAPLSWQERLIAFYRQVVLA